MSTNEPSKKFTTAYVAGLRAGATKRDISDPAVRGLVLRVLTTGTKTFLFRFKWNGVPTRISLGTFPSLGLADARTLALKNQGWLEQGIDPRKAVDRSGKSPRP